MATRIYKTPFAATGDKEVLATADQPDGKVSLQAGWTPDYELPNDNANYRPVGRAEMNGILSEVTEGLGEVQLNGFAKWQSIDGGWPLGAQVSVGGDVYRSSVSGNTSDPGTGGAGWDLMATGIATQVETNAGTNDTKAITPKKLRFAFGVLLAANGYIAFPSWLGGLIFQWGGGITGESGSGSVTFPVAFSSAVFRNFPLVLGPGYINVLTGVNTGFTFTSVGGSSGVNFNYFSIGV